MSREQWSRKYASCRECGRTDRPHHGKGLCKVCHAAKWSKTSKGKDVRENYRKRLAADPEWRERESERVRRWYHDRRKSTQGPGPTAGAVEP